MDSYRLEFVQLPSENISKVSVCVNNRSYTVTPSLQDQQDLIDVLYKIYENLERRMKASYNEN